MRYGTAPDTWSRVKQWFQYQQESPKHLLTILQLGNTVSSGKLTFCWSFLLPTFIPCLYPPPIYKHIRALPENQIKWSLCFLKGNKKDFHVSHVLCSCNCIWYSPMSRPSNNNDWISFSFIFASYLGAILSCNHSFPDSSHHIHVALFTQPPDSLNIFPGPKRFIVIHLWHFHIDYNFKILCWRSVSIH